MKNYCRSRCIENRYCFARQDTVAVDVDQWQQEPLLGNDRAFRTIESGYSPLFYFIFEKLKFFV